MRGREVAFVVLVGMGITACADLDPTDGVIVAPCVEGDSDPARDTSFENDIRPIMNGTVMGTKGCKGCHYASQPTHVGLDQTGLNLETLGTLRKGGANTAGIIVVPGSACQSAIVQKLKGSFHIGARMPKGGPFWTDAQIQLMADWIVEGAKGDDSE